LFELLISASGVTCARAKGILSGMSVRLDPSGSRGDLVRLTRIPASAARRLSDGRRAARTKLAAMGTPETRGSLPRRQAPPRMWSPRYSISAMSNTPRSRLSNAPAEWRAGIVEALLRATLQQLSAPAQKGARAAR